MMSKIKSLSVPAVFILTLIVLVSAALRLHDLNVSPTHSDEMNFMVAAKETALLDLWRNPPWTNQMPFGDSFAILWAKIMPQREVDIALVREPFAILGVLTVLLSIVFMYRYAGIYAATLAGVWLTFHPFLIYHSREAYYYGPALLFTTGATFCTVGLLSTILERKLPKPSQWVMFLLWSTLACLSHMSVWILVASMALIILVTGLVSFDGKNRVLFCRNAVMVYLLIGLAMSRWIYRAVQEVLKLQQTNTSHIGYDMKWVASRLFPLLFGGINATGGVLLSITIGSFFLLIISKKVDFWKSKNNLNLRLLTFLLISGFTLSFLYIFLHWEAALPNGSTSRRWPRLLYAGPHGYGTPF